MHELSMRTSCGLWRSALNSELQKSISQLSVESDMGERLPHQLNWRAHMVENWHGMCDAALINV